MLPDFALHHLPLYAVTLFAAGGLGLWVWMRFTLTRQAVKKRREAIADKALASSRVTLLDFDELTSVVGSRERSWTSFLLSQGCEQTSVFRRQGVRVHLPVGLT